MNNIRINTLARESKAEVLKISYNVNKLLLCDDILNAILTLENCEKINELFNSMMDVVNAINSNLPNSRSAKKIEKIATTVCALGHILQLNKETVTR